MITETATTIGYRKSLVTCSDKPREAIIKANNNLEESIDAKDWELIGSDIENLQKLINQLEDLKAEENRKEAENDEENSISLFN